MRVLFTADLHIRIGQKNIPREWARNRYAVMFKEFDRIKKEHNIDLEIHGGDIFDKLPNLEELGTYIRYVGTCSDLVIYDGNHEATKKGKTFFGLLEGLLINANSKCRLILDYYTATTEIPFDILPYCKLKEYEKTPSSATTPLLTHVRGEIPPHVSPEVDLSIFKNRQVVFAGDLHAHSNTQGNLIYPGSPTTVSFHRNKVDTGVIVIDTDDMSWAWHKIKVPQLLRRTITDPKDMIKTPYDHTIYELQGDAIDLAGISSDVLDKKIIKTTEEATLDLVNMTMREEMIAYLTSIVGIVDKDKLNTCMRYYDDYITKT